MSQFKLEYSCLEYPKTDGTKQRALILMATDVPTPRSMPPRTRTERLIKVVLAFEDGQMGERIISFGDFHRAQQNPVHMIEDKSMAGAKGLSRNPLVRPDGTPIR